MSRPKTRGLTAESVGLWSTLSAAILAQQVGSKTIRDGLFLSQVGADALPRAMLLSALLSVPTVLGTSTALSRFGPRRVAAGLLALSGGLFLLEWALLDLAPSAIAWLTYLQIATLGSTTISAFFSNVAEHFDPHRARKASSRVTSGAAVGGVIGGLGVGLLARAFSQRELFLMLALINFGASLVLSRMHGGPPREASDRSGLPVALSGLGKSRYLQNIALLVLLTGFTSALLDFNFKQQAAASLGRGPELLQLFAAFYTGTAIATAIVQLLIAQPALERIGLAGTLAALPGSLLLGGALGAFIPRLWSTLLLRGAGSVLESSLFRSAYEPLYTPLSQRTRRGAKTLIDVAFGRLGEASGSLALLVLIWLWPSSQLVAALVCAMLGAAAALFLSIHMHSGYVAELTTSLRKGSVRLQQNDVADSTTRLALSQTHMELERAQLLAEIAAQRVSKVPPSPTDPLLTATADLLSREPTRVRQLLERGPLDRRLVPLAIGLLGHDPLAPIVSKALTDVAAQSVGQLIDALHDPDLPVSVRRRLPRIVRYAGDGRAAAGLLLAMRAPERVVRYRAASALGALTSDHPELVPATDTVFELARAELQDHGGEDGSMQHLFVILSLALDRDALRLAHDAMASGDVRQRGTALEYLHSTVPEPLRSELVGWLETRQPRASERDTLGTSDHPSSRRPTT